MRGRQLARLLIVGPVAIVLAAVLPGIAAPDRYPWVLALVPALLGGGAGLILVRSAFGAYPMPGQRTGSPFAAGGNPGILRVAFQLGSTLLLAVVAAPVLAVLALTTGAVAWLGVPVGLGAGGYEVRPVE